METNLTDINDVCHMLGTTSRTLRYYEEKGIIQSISGNFQPRRKYSAEQIEHIKHVLILRALGLSISKIQQLQQGNIDLSVAISQHKAELTATVVAKAKELALLDEALATIEYGGNIFEEKEQNDKVTVNRQIEIANSFTDSFLNGDIDVCFGYFTDILKEYLPQSAFRRVTSDVLRPLGRFVKKGNFEHSREFNNVIYCNLIYEKLGLYIKLVFYEAKIQGIWFNYYGIKESD